VSENTLHVSYKTNGLMLVCEITGDSCGNHRISFQAFCGQHAELSNIQASG